MTWTVYQLDVRNQQDGRENVVVTVYWTCSSAEDDMIYRSSTSLELSESFTEYEQLTQQEILSWVWQFVDKSAIETMLENRITESQNPVVVKTTMPWQ